jgi:hypothetical protein
MGISPETPLTDRQLLCHLLDHVETMHTQMADLLERFGPLLDRLAPAAGSNGQYGGAGYVGMLRAAREIRRGSPGP